jgi:hypothetical protein
MLRSTLLADPRQLANGNSRRYQLPIVAGAIPGESEKEIVAKKQEFEPL